MDILRVGLCFSPKAVSACAGMHRSPPCDVLILPELFDGGYAALRNGAPHRLTTDDYFLTYRRASARNRITYILGSTAVRDRKGRRSNACLVYRSGRQVHRYDKLHLFVPGGDDRLFSPGRSLRTFSIPHGKAGIKGGVLLCYDLRFPEAARVLALLGMKVLFVPARWPAVRDDAWQALLKARAIENQVFVVGCNSRDAEGGYSYIMDPLGVAVWSNRARSHRSFVRVALDLDRLRVAREFHRNIREALLLHQLAGVHGASGSVAYRRPSINRR